MRACVVWLLLVAPCFAQGVTVPTLAEHANVKATADAADAKATQAQSDVALLKAEIDAIKARLAKLETPTPAPTPEPTPEPQPEPEPTPEPVTRLIQSLEYVGSFRVPATVAGKGDEASYQSDYTYGGTALSYNPANDSLFLAGHDWYQRIGEIKIPEVRKAETIGGLARATVLQPLMPVKSRVPEYSLEGNVKVGGTLVVGNKLIVSLYEFYDADADAVKSHFAVDPNNVTSGAVTGLFQVGAQRGGYVGGYMAHVPSSWQDKLGCKYLTGLCGVPIISRTSAGPCLFGFDPDNWATAIPLVYYPFWQGGRGENDHPITDTTSQNPLYNQTSTVGGVVFPEGTDSVLFIGANGTGPYWYGVNGDYHDLNDPARTSKGPHAYPYVYQVWAYDANDLLKVKAGDAKPWEIKPYATWTLDLPWQHSARGHGGCAIDSQGRIFFVAANAGPWGEPAVHVLRVK